MPFSMILIIREIALNWGVGGINLPTVFLGLLIPFCTKQGSIFYFNKCLSVLYMFVHQRHNWRSR